MQRLMGCLFVVLFASLKTGAQILPPLQPEQDACGALKICGGIFQSPASYCGAGNLSEFINNGASSIVNNYANESHSVWFELNVATDGDIIFTLNVLNDYYANYGFSVYNITNSNCSGLSMNELERFTAWMGQGASGGLTPGATATIYSMFTLNTQNYLAPIAAHAGERYLICVHQYYRPARNGFTLDFTGSTASFSNNNLPGFAGIVPSCNQSQRVDVRMNMPVTCASIASDGSDVYVTPGNINADTAWGTNCDQTGYTRQIGVHFAQPLTPGQYWLHITPGSDGNTTTSLCGSQQLPADSILFTVAPYFPLTYKSIEDPGCLQTRIYFSHAVRCSSVASDGSDFGITGPSVVEIARAVPIGCNTANDKTDSVMLILKAPIPTDGIYTIASRKGTDGNTVQDSCGQEQLINDLLVFNVNTWRSLIAEHDTVLCQSELFPLHTSVPFASPHLDSCDLNYVAPTGGVSIVQSEPLQIGIPGIPAFTGAVITPFLKSFSDMKLQYVYHHEELIAMGLQQGLITELSWFLTYDRDVPTPFRNFTIKMGCTTEDSITSGFIPATHLVYTSDIVNVLNSGWKNFILQVPFAWMDTNINLVVEVCFDNKDEDGGSLSEVALVAKTEKDFSASYMRYGWSMSGCSMSSTQGSLLLSHERPVTRLGFKSAPDTGFKYSWLPAQGLDDPVIANPVAAVADDISYTFSTVDKAGCLLKDTIRLGVSPFKGAIAPADTLICPGDRITLLASGGAVFSWTTADPSISCTTCADPLVQPSLPFSYTAFITDIYNCTDTANANVNLLPAASVVAFPQDTLVDYGSQIQLSTSAQNAQSYLWSPASGLNNPIAKDPLATVTGPTAYVVEVRTDFGCLARDTVFIDVDFRDQVFIPDAFSPNGDGLNDVFQVGNRSFQKITEFRVFNRWGENVYSSANGMGWDGKYKNMLQDNGAYFYLIRIAFPDGYSRMYKGEVLLIR
jgi:gliding motility-associated-like protein